MTDSASQEHKPFFLRIRYMKNTSLLAMLALMMTMNIAHAEESTAQVDYKEFCNEQAQIAGIEDAEELKQYVKDCLESYIGPADE